MYTSFHTTDKNKKGFTLIELLVVIAVISILTAVVLVSLSNARSRTRDTRRVTDLKALQTALELYNLKYGTYQVCDHTQPATSPAYSCTVGGVSYKGAGAWGQGDGWVAFEGYLPGVGWGPYTPAYTMAITKALYNEGFLPTPFLDDPRVKPLPSGNPMSDGSYLLYLCPTGGPYTISFVFQSVYLFETE